MSSKKKRHAAHQSVQTKLVSPQKTTNWLMVPVLLALALVPLTLHLVIVEVDPTEASLFGFTEFGDYFSQGKASLLAVLACVMAAALLILRKKAFPPSSSAQKLYLISGGVFIAAAFLSSVFSKYAGISFWGAHDRAEGFFTLLCYWVLFACAACACRGEEDSRHLAAAFGIVLAVSAFLGIFQYTGHDLVQTDFFKALTIAPWDRSRVSGTITKSNPGTLYGTFSHLDYVGSVGAMALPFFLVLTAAEKDKKRKWEYAAGTALAAWLQIGSTSRAGAVGTAAALLLGLIVFSKVIFRSWKVPTACAAVLAAGVIALNFASKGSVFSRIPSVFSDAAAVFQTSADADYLSKLPVKDVAAKGNTVVVTAQDGSVLNAALSGTTLSLTDGSGNAVPAASSSDGTYAAQGNFKRFAFRLQQIGSNNELGLVLAIDGQAQFYFTISDSQLTMTNAAGTWTVSSLATPPHFGFSGKEKIGSARGYIWSRANAMIPGCLLLGAGPDTFALQFPQDDLLGKYWAYGTTNMVVDKPHNLYLQILLGEGGIALLAFLAAVVFYLADSLRLYARKREYGPSAAFGAALSLAVFGYLISGLFNDSIVSVAPIFWILLGAGAAVNARNRKSAETENQPGRENGAA